MEVVSRRKHPQNSITIKFLSFEKFHNFKYLGLDINLQEDNHRKYIEKSELETNATFHQLNYLKSKSYSEEQK